MSTQLKMRMWAQWLCYCVNLWELEEWVCLMQQEWEAGWVQSRAAELVCNSAETWWHSHNGCHGDERRHITCRLCFFNFQIRMLLLVHNTFFKVPDIGSLRIRTLKIFLKTEINQPNHLRWSEFDIPQWQIKKVCELLSDCTTMAFLITGSEACQGCHGENFLQLNHLGDCNCSGILFFFPSGRMKTKRWMMTSKWNISFLINFIFVPPSPKNYYIQKGDQNSTFARQDNNVYTINKACINKKSINRQDIMCQENKDSSRLADGFHNVGFFWNYMYVILAFHVTVF